MGDPSYSGAGNKWLTFDVWPPTSVSDAALYFSAGGSLSVASGATSSSVSFVSDPSSPCPTAGGTNNLSTTNPGGPEDQSAIESRPDVVVFTSPVESMAMEIIGHISADVWIETNVPDVDVVVRMTDVHPRGGGSMLMAQGIQRARYRNGPCASLLTASTPTLVRVGHVVDGARARAGSRAPRHRERLRRSPLRGQPSKRRQPRRWEPESDRHDRRPLRRKHAIDAHSSRRELEASRRGCRRRTDDLPGRVFSSTPLRLKTGLPRTTHRLATGPRKTPRRLETDRR